MRRHGFGELVGERCWSAIRTAVGHSGDCENVVDVLGLVKESQTFGRLKFELNSNEVVKVAKIGHFEAVEESSLGFCDQLGVPDHGEVVHVKTNDDKVALKRAPNVET